MTYQIQGQHIYLKPPPKPVYAIDVSQLEQDLYDLMDRYKLTVLTCELKGAPDAQD
jgi:hypothetical protein